MNILQKTPEALRAAGCNVPAGFRTAFLFREPGQPGIYVVYTESIDAYQVSLFGCSASTGQKPTCYGSFEVYLFTIGYTNQWTEQIRTHAQRHWMDAEEFLEEVQKNRPQDWTD